MSVLTVSAGINFKALAENEPIELWGITAKSATVIPPNYIINLIIVCFTNWWKTKN